MLEIILTSKVVIVDKTTGMTQQNHFAPSFDLLAIMSETIGVTQQGYLSLSFAFLMFEESTEECMLGLVPLSGLEDRCCW